MTPTPVPSPSLEDTIATALAVVHTSVCGGDNSYSNKDVLQLILDEEGAEALVEAVLSAASVVPAEPAGHDTPLFEGTLIELDDWLADPELRYRDNRRVAVYPRAAVAGVDGEAPAT